MDTYDNIIKQYEQIALSNHQVLKLVEGKANVIVYPNLINYNSIDEILEPYGACFLLFEAKPQFGHWCAIIKLDNETIEFFNPYGGYPDDSLKYIPYHFRLVSNQLYPYLSYLLLNSQYNLTYNEHQFQKKELGINTCGRWCAARIYYKNLSLKDFFDTIKELKKKYKGSNDEIITMLTMWINNE